jgi:hypothetical protein
LRYRANNCPPPGRRVCAFCGSTRNVEIHHLDGHEEHTEQGNLSWACRRCNTQIGIVLKRVGLGRRTRQFNPPSAGATSLGQWVTAVQSMKGESDAMDIESAVEMIRATPPARRSQFAQEIWRIRRERGTDRPVPF